MKSSVSRLRTTRRPAQAGFSLVEVTLAVGIMAFSLVGILGVLPLALDSGRQGFNQARASAVANTLFTSLRSQPFNDVHYLDEQFDSTGAPITGAPGTLDLNNLGVMAVTPGATANATPSGTVKFYAKFLDVPTDLGLQEDTLGSQRRLCLTRDQPMVGADYLVTMYFNNQPEGTIVPSAAAGRVGQANRVTLVVTTASRDTGAPARDPFRFVTTVANRLN